MRFHIFLLSLVCLHCNSEYLTKEGDFPGHFSQSDIRKLGNSVLQGSEFNDAIVLFVEPDRPKVVGVIKKSFKAKSMDGMPFGTTIIIGGSNPDQAFRVFSQAFKKTPKIYEGTLIVFVGLPKHESDMGELVRKMGGEYRFVSIVEKSETKPPK